MNLKLDRFPADSEHVCDVQEIDILTDTGEVLLSIRPDLENDRVEIRTAGSCVKNNGVVLDSHMVVMPTGSNSIIVGRPPYK